MKRMITALMVGAFVVTAAGVSFAGEKAQAAKKPVKMTAAQMDQVVAGRRAGYDDHYNYKTGDTNQVGDNSSKNDQRGSNGNGSKIYDWNSN